VLTNVECFGTTKNKGRSNGNALPPDNGPLVATVASGQLNNAVAFELFVAGAAPTAATATLPLLPLHAPFHVPHRLFSTNKLSGKPSFAAIFILMMILQSR